MTAVTITRENSGETTSLPLGGEIDIVLPETPASGYRWIFDAENIDTVDLGVTLGQGASVGGGGMRALRIRARSKGEATVKASLRRSWEDASKAAARCVFHFVVS